MCGRFVRFSPLNNLLAQMGVPQTQPLPSVSYNLAPSDALLVIRNTDRGQREWVALKWGFLPHWAKDPQLRQPINARSEEVHKKPYFRDAFRHRRCLVVFDGWYEWRQLAGRKQPYYVTLKGEPPFAFAGLWDHWQRMDDPATETCCILTTEANESLKTIHPRMPVVVAPDNYDRWLDPAVVTRDSLAGILVPYPGDAIQSWPVSTWVNKPEHNDQRCLERHSSGELV